VDTETVTAYIGLGSNLGDRAGNLLMAVRGLMEASFEVTKLSAIYETEPVEMDDAPGFLNMVAEIRAESITPTQMLARMLRIEYLLGRKEKSLKLPSDHRHRPAVLRRSQDGNPVPDPAPPAYPPSPLRPRPARRGLADARPSLCCTKISPVYWMRPRTSLTSPMVPERPRALRLACTLG
jgi:hypothetical protein